ncbi:MAG: cation:proton antiporter [Nitrosopumilaceae archaeon]
MQVEEFFIGIVIILVVAKLFGELFRRIKQPALVGELLAGMILGPSLFGLFQPTDAFSVFKGLAVFFLMFLAGMEMNINEIRKASKRAIIISMIAFIVPFVAGQQLGLFFGLDNIQSLFIGLLLSITAIPVSAIILMEFGILKTKIGNTIITAAVINDILALLVLTIILQLPSDGSFSLNYTDTGISILKISFFFASIIALVLIINKKSSQVSQKVDLLISKFRTKEAGFGILLILAISLSLFAHYSDLHFIVGAFFAGLIFGKNFSQKHGKRAYGLVSGFTFGLFAPIFFALIGLEFNAHSLMDSMPLFVSLLAVAIVTKVCAGYLGARITRFSHNDGLVIGCLMNGRGMVELAIASIGFSVGILDVKLFSIAVAIGFITTILTPIIAKPFVEKLKLRQIQDQNNEIRLIDEKFDFAELNRITQKLETKVSSNEDETKIIEQKQKKILVALNEIPLIDELVSESK